MVTERRALIAGNWKMNLDHLQAIATVQKLAWTLDEAKHNFAEVEVAVFPPFTDIRSVQTLVGADKLSISYGGQDISAHESGAYTGEIAGSFLKALDCEYVIIGHSERRTLHNETDELINAKVKAAIANDIVPVLCVGETAEDLELHGASAVPIAQLRKNLAGVSSNDNIVIAYEPVWAIGSGQAATPEQAQQVANSLRSVIAELLSPEAADRTRILYGGSVKSGNIATFMKQPDVDGALVGGASLDAEEFAKIARFPAHVTI